MNINKLRKEMQKKNIDISLILSLNEEPSTNLRYFTEYSGVGILAVTKKTYFFIVPEYERKKKCALKKEAVEKKKRLFERLFELLENKRFKNVGIEFDTCPISVFKRIKKIIKGRYVNISDICYGIRAKKDTFELNYIKKACKVTDDIYSKICNNFKFKTEDDIREFIEHEARKNGCELAFPPIAASAIGSREVHYVGNKVISNGFLMLDFGVKYRGYCSDMTRMLYIGKPSVQELNDFKLVLRTIEECEYKAINKKKFSDIHQLSIDLLGDKAIYFTHALGHGLGLDIHEPPSLRLDDNAAIKENIAFTIEPGIYLRRYGIRLEDTVVIQNNKLIRLTKSKKDLMII